MRRTKKRFSLSQTVLALSLFVVVAGAVAVLANQATDLTSQFVQAATRTVTTVDEFHAALAAAQPGDTIVINGTLNGNLRIAKSGTSAGRITIRGGTIRGGSGRLVELRNANYLVFDGVTFDATGADSAVYLLHSTYNTFINSHFANAGGECIRVKIQSNNNSFLNNRIENCGRRGFNPPSSKNGEGIYIGTAPEQLYKNADEGFTNAPDTTQQNLIRGNTITTNANECVDIKEAAIFNLVEGNRCNNQLDDSSGAFDSRGEHNIFRSNIVTAEVRGAGVRLGGDTSSNGIQNCVINNNLGAYSTTVGAIKVMTSPQKAMCGNTTFTTRYGSGNFPPTVAITTACTQVEIDRCLDGRTYGSSYESVETPTPPTPTPTATPITPTATPATPRPTPTATATPRPTATPTVTPSPTPTGNVINGELPVVSVSASSDDGNVAANVLDRNYDTRWSAEGEGEWIRFDLGRTYRVTKVAISFYRGNKRRAEFDVEASTDGSKWKRIYRGRSSGKSTSMQEFNVSDTDARYLRIVNRGNSENEWASYKEVIWYGK